MPKTGGRRKGTPNKSTKVLLENIEKTGVTPLQFLIDQMRDTKNPLGIRVQCAAKAAPYLHRKMPTEIESNVSGEENQFPKELRIEFVSPNGVLKMPIGN